MENLRTQSNNFPSKKDLELAEQVRFDDDDDDSMLMDKVTNKRDRNDERLPESSFSNPVGYDRQRNDHSDDEDYGSMLESLKNEEKQAATRSTRLSEQVLEKQSDEFDLRTAIAESGAPLTPEEAAYSCFYQRVPYSREVFQAFRNMTPDDRKSFVAVVTFMGKLNKTPVDYSKVEEAYPGGNLWSNISDLIIGTKIAPISTWPELIKFIYQQLAVGAAIKDGVLSLYGQKLVTFGPLAYHLEVEHSDLYKEIYKKTITKEVFDFAGLPLMPYFTNGYIQYIGGRWSFSLLSLPESKTPDVYGFAIPTVIAKARRILAKKFVGGRAQTWESFAGALSIKFLSEWSAFVRKELEAFYAEAKTKEWMTKNVRAILANVTTFSQRNKAYRADVHKGENFVVTPQFDFSVGVANYLPRRRAIAYYFPNTSVETVANDSDADYLYTAVKPDEVTITRFRTIRINYTRDAKVLESWAQKISATGLKVTVHYVQRHSIEFYVRRDRDGVNDASKLYLMFKNEAIRIWLGEIDYMINMVSGTFPIKKSGGAIGECLKVTQIPEVDAGEFKFDF